MTIHLDADIPNDASTLDAVFVKQGNSLVPYFVSEISVKGNKAYATFEEVDTLEKAQALSKCLLYLPKGARPKSGKNTFYDDEIVNFLVVDKQKGNIGTVTEVLNSGLQKLLSITEGEDEILIPINDIFIKKVDRKKSIIEVDLPDGFLEMNKS